MKTFSKTFERSIVKSYHGRDPLSVGSFYLYGVELQDELDIPPEVYKNCTDVLFELEKGLIYFDDCDCNTIHKQAFKIVLVP